MATFVRIADQVGKILYINPDQICFLEAYGNETVVQCSDAVRHRIPLSVDDLIKKLGAYKVGGD